MLVTCTVLNFVFLYHSAHFFPFPLPMPTVIFMRLMLAKPTLLMLVKGQKKLGLCFPFCPHADALIGMAARHFGEYKLYEHLVEIIFTAVYIIFNFSQGHQP